MISPGRSRTSVSSHATDLQFIQGCWQVLQTHSDFQPHGHGRPLLCNQKKLYVYLP